MLPSENVCVDKAKCDTKITFLNVIVIVVLSSFIL